MANTSCGGGGARSGQCDVCSATRSKIDDRGDGGSAGIGELDGLAEVQRQRECAACEDVLSAGRINNRANGWREGIEGLDVLSRGGGNVTGSIRHASGDDINGDVSGGCGSGSNNEGINSAADGGEGAFRAVADGDVAGREASDSF